MCVKCHRSQVGYVITKYIRSCVDGFGDNIMILCVQDITLQHLCTPECVELVESCAR